MATKSGKTVPFRLTPSQRRIWFAILSQRNRRKPVRIKVLKYRQAQASTFCIALMTLLTAYTAGLGAISIADKRELPTTWLRKATNWITQIPGGLRPHVKNSNAIELYFDKIGSRYGIGSAQGQTPGMGFTIQAAHFSEVAYWVANPDDILSKAIPSLPNKAGTTVLFESTGETVGDWWYQSWWASKRGEDDYEALFLPWYLDPEYRRDDLASDIIELTPREKEIVRLAQEEGLEVDRGMLAWRRAGVMGEPFRGDEEAFDCKFPSCPMDAFLSGGRAIFTRSQVERAALTVRDPVWRGMLITRRTPDDYSLEPCDSEEVLIWEHPEPGLHYVIGADVQWGTGKAPDFDNAYVECLETSRVVARLRGQWHMGRYSLMLASLGHHYNDAVLAPERNSMAAEGVMAALRGLSGNDWSYGNLWLRSDPVKFKGFRPEDYGWLTDRHSKGELILFASSHGVDWADRLAVDEMQSYIRPEDNNPSAPPGAHDDALMSRMITAYVAHRLRVYLPQEESVTQTFAQRLRQIAEERDAEEDEEDDCGS